MGLSYYVKCEDFCVVFFDLVSMLTNRITGKLRCHSQNKPQSLHLWENVLRDIDDNPNLS